MQTFCGFNDFLDLDLAKQRAIDFLDFVHSSLLINIDAIFHERVEGQADADSYREQLEKFLDHSHTGSVSIFFIGEGIQQDTSHFIFNDLSTIPFVDVFNCITKHAVNPTHVYIWVIGCYTENVDVLFQAANSDMTRVDKPSKYSGRFFGTSDNKCVSIREVQLTIQLWLEMAKINHLSVDLSSPTLSYRHGCPEIKFVSDNGVIQFSMDLNTITPHAYQSMIAKTAAEPKLGLVGGKLLKSRKYGTWIAANLDNRYVVLFRSVELYVFQNLRKADDIAGLVVYHQIENRFCCRIWICNSSALEEDKSQPGTVYGNLFQKVFGTTVIDLKGSDVLGGFSYVNKLWKFSSGFNRGEQARSMSTLEIQIVARTLQHFVNLKTDVQKKCTHTSPFLLDLDSFHDDTNYLAKLYKDWK